MFPPLVVFEEGERFWLAEGFHRLEAYTAAEYLEVPCDVRPGGLRDAILHSVGANATHGLQRTNADKRRAVGILLEDELVLLDPTTGHPWSNREIARRCAVAEGLVRKLRSEAVTAHGTQSDSIRAYPDRHGNVSRMRTDRIGRKAEADPNAPAEGEAQGEASAEAKPEASEAQAQGPAAEPSPEFAPVIRLTQELAQQFRREAEHYRNGEAATPGVIQREHTLGRQQQGPTSPALEE